MRRFLKAMVMFARQGRWQGSAPQWEEQDGRALAGFLRSATGGKLQGLMRSEIAAANERAAMSKGGAFECGWACGYRGLYAWFEALGEPTTPAGDEKEIGHPAVEERDFFHP